MSFVNVAPQLVSTAAADAARIGSAINTANTAAAATTQVLAAAQDEVSTAIAALFGSHGQHYQAISAQVAAYQQRFVLALSQAGSTYAVAEAASATPLQNVLDAINAPVQSLTGRPRRHGQRRRGRGRRRRRCARRGWCRRWYVDRHESRQSRRSGHSG